MFDMLGPWPWQTADLQNVLALLLLPLLLLPLLLLVGVLN
jgi:hypothetical protein